MLALVMSGGGARAAYQIGVLRAIARRHPDLQAPILTGVSAGAINAACLACRCGDFRSRVESVVDLWRELSTDHVFRVDSGWLGRNVIRWGMRLVAGGAARAPRVRGLMDTAPMRALLQRVLSASPEGWIGGVEENLARGDLAALAVTASSYAKGVTTTWVHGRIPEEGARPGLLVLPARLQVDHVMASSALPFLFPSVCVDGEWFGDGGVSLTAPLAPARRLGATKIFAVSTRSLNREVPAEAHYPSPAEIAGALINAIFLDVFDVDALRMEQINRLIRPLPAAERLGLRHIDLMVMRPSQQLGRIANEFETKLPMGLRFLTRGLGTRESRNSDFLSMIMFQPDYHMRLIELGEADAEQRKDEIDAFLERAS